MFDPKGVDYGEIARLLWRAGVALLGSLLFSLVRPMSVTINEMNAVVHTHRRRNERMRGVCERSNRRPVDYAILPFRVNVTRDAELAELRRLVQATRWADREKR